MSKKSTIAPGVGRARSVIYSVKYRLSIPSAVAVSSLGRVRWRAGPDCSSIWIPFCPTHTATRINRVMQIFILNKHKLALINSSKTSPSTYVVGTRGNVFIIYDGKHLVVWKFRIPMFYILIRWKCGLDLCEINFYFPTRDGTYPWNMYSRFSGLLNNTKFQKFCVILHTPQ